MVVKWMADSARSKTGQQSILVVDDQAEIRDLLQQIFDSQGYNTRTAVDGEEALTAVRFQRPDLITLDLAMPRINGHEVLRQLARDPRTASIPVIVVSAYPCDLCPTKQVAGVIPKPFEIHELIEAVSVALTD